MKYEEQTIKSYLRPDSFYPYGAGTAYYGIFFSGYSLQYH